MRAIIISSKIAGSILKSWATALIRKNLAYHPENGGIPANENKVIIKQIVTGGEV